MRPGQAVELKIDAFGGRAFKGSVESVAPASGAQFAVLPSDNATGNFTKNVQRIPVKIRFDPVEHKGRTGANCSGDVGRCYRGGQSLSEFAKNV